MTLLSRFQITSVFLLTLIISTVSTAWNKNRIGIPSMFTAENDKTALDILTILLEIEEPEKDVYPDTLLVSEARNGQLKSVIGLLKMNVDPDTRSDNNNNTALIWAAHNGDLKMVKVLLEWRATPNLRDYNGYTPLIHAAHENHLEVVKVLLEWGANPYSKNENGYNSLIWAILQDNSEVVSVLLDTGMDPNSGIFAAVVENRLESATALLAGGANPNLPNNSGNTPLTWAISYNHVAVTEVLLEWGADPNATLFGAVREKLVEVVRYLLLIGADPNLQDNNGNTPLMLAAMNNDLETAKVLSEQGADPNLSDHDGNTPLMWAALNGYLPFVEFFLNWEEININLPNHEGYTALIRAIYGRDLQVITALLEAGADLNAQDYRGRTALTSLVYTPYKEGDLEIMRALLARGADPNHKDQHSYTMLMGAAYNGDVEIVTTLLEWGANPNSQDHKGNTAIWWANRSGHPNITTLLEGS